MTDAEHAQLQAALFRIAADRLAEQRKWSTTLEPPDEHRLLLAKFDQEEREIRQRLAQLNDIPSPTVAGRLNDITAAIFGVQADYAGFRSEWRQQKQLDALERVQRQQYLDTLERQRQQQTILLVSAVGVGLLILFARIFRHERHADA